MTYDSRTRAQRNVDAVLILEIEGIGTVLVEEQVAAPVVVPAVDLAAPPDIYVTWDPENPTGNAGINEGVVSPGIDSAVSDAAALTLTTGQVDQGVLIGGFASQMNIYGAGLTATAGRVGAWAMWVRFPSDLTTDPWRFALTQNNTFGGWYLYRTPGRTMFLQTEGSSSGDYGGCGSTTVLAVDEWHHVAWDIDSTAAAGAGLCHLYIDGVLEGTGAGFTPNNDNVPAGAQTGWSRHGVTFSGKEDEFLFRRSVWAADEVANMYAAGVASLKVTW